MAKSEAELYGLLADCESSQLDAIAARLELKPMFLPGAHEPPATRAAVMIRLIRKARKLEALETLLDEMHGVAPQALDGCILILAANPLDTDRLRFDKEISLIRQRLEEDEAGRRYHVEIALAAAPTDLSRLLLRYEPRIVHFCGHGARGEIMLEGEGGTAKAVAGKALAGLFAVLKGTELVVLNACYSAEQAEPLSQVVPHVIGMSGSIGDEDALSFAAGFYRALAHGRDYATAFRLGCSEIELAALPDAAVPRYLTGGAEQLGKPAPA